MGEEEEEEDKKINETNELTVKPLLVPIQLTDLDYARVVIGPVSYLVKRETNHESHLKARTKRERERERE